MIVVRTVAELREAVAPGRPGASIGFVPTMGALHDGHVALVRAARGRCSRVVASAFVNPKQFDNSADLAGYPHDEARDAGIARRAGVDVLFVPDVAEVFPAGHATTVHVEGAARGFEGAFRPGHFDGVATVCLTLFAMVEPDVVFLGQKDVQQVAVLRQVVRDLRLDLEIEVVPTVREADGLALSSRNVRLSAVERARALAIPRALWAAVAAHGAGVDPVEAAREVLADLDVEYVDVATFDGDRTLVVAVRAGATRLIDNVPLDRPALAGFREGALPS